MNVEKLQNLIHIDTNKEDSSYQISIKNSQILKGYSSIRFNLFIYPLTKQVNADDFRFLPYEEYIDDLHRGRRSSYELINDSSSKIFGFLLGLIIFFIFLIFNPSDLFSIQSIVSVFGAYTIGKELWNDIDNSLMRLTKSWRLSWRDSSLPYQREDFGTIQKFWKLARYIRNKDETVIPSQFDFISQSNSKVLEIKLNKNEIRNLTQDTPQILKIDFEDEKFTKLQRDFMLGARITFTRTFLIVDAHTEIFQGIKEGNYGTIGRDDNWLAGTIMLRHTWKIGRIKYYSSTRYFKDIKMILEN